MSEDRLCLHQLACEVAFRILTAHQPALALARFCDDLADEVAAGQNGLGDTEFLRAAFRDAIGYSTKVPDAVGEPDGKSLTGGAATSGSPTALRVIKGGET